MLFVKAAAAALVSALVVLAAGGLVAGVAMVSFMIADKIFGGQLALLFWPVIFFGISAFVCVFIGVYFS